MIIFKKEPAKRKGRPLKNAGEKKINVHIRLSPETVNEFKKDGAGWQTRIDEALKDWLKKKGKQNGKHD